MTTAPDQANPPEPTPENAAAKRPPVPRHDPTMLTPAELEALREDSKRSSEVMEQLLAKDKLPK